MAKEIVKDPQIFISKEARKLYENMQTSFEEFKKLDNKDFFLLMLVFGCLNEKKKTLSDQDAEKSGFTRERYLDPEENAILKAIAITEKNDIALVNDIPEAYAIAEEYANGGMNFLKEFVYDNPASFVKKFAAMLKDCNK